MRYSFSSYFNELDDGDVKSYSERKYQNKKYRGLIALWKKPLEQKRKRQERIKQIKEALPVPPVEGEKLVVHNSAVGIAYPPGKNEIFCVIKANGFQYKVTEDCLLIVDTTEEHEINKTIKFDQVLLAGTATYTVLGRPVVNNTYVEGVVESISESEKTIVFKKKRRKQYKKSFGSRVKLTSLRITRIVHELTSETLSRAVGLTETRAEDTSMEAIEGK
jgi:large subunit ribosomal protein L21